MQPADSTAETRLTDFCRPFGPGPPGGYALPRGGAAARIGRMIRRLAPLFLAAGLAACASQPQPPSQPPAQAPRIAPAACGAEPHLGLVGQPWAALERVLILREVRLIRPGQPITKDLRPERINFEIGTDGRIARVFCG